MAANNSDELLKSVTRENNELKATIAKLKEDSTVVKIEHNKKIKEVLAKEQKTLIFVRNQVVTLLNQKDNYEEKLNELLVDIQMNIVERQFTQRKWESALTPIRRNPSPGIAGPASLAAISRPPSPAMPRTSAAKPFVKFVRSPVRAPEYSHQFVRNQHYYTTGNRYGKQLQIADTSYQRSYERRPYPATYRGAQYTREHTERQLRQGEYTNNNYYQ